MARWARRALRGSGGRQFIFRLVQVVSLQSLSFLNSNRMPHKTTIVLGIAIPSTDPAFLTTVAFHVLAGLVCVAAGVIAMLSEKRPGRHPNFGTIYYWSLAAVFASATALAVVRWAEDYHLFILGTLSFGAAFLGRTARRQQWRGWVRLHLTSMGVSYILLLTAFYMSTTERAFRFGKSFLQ